MIRARRLFSINGLFVRFTVDDVFVLLLVSWAPMGDGDAVDVDGDIGPKFIAELVPLLTVDAVFNFESVHSICHKSTHNEQRTTEKEKKNNFKMKWKYFWRQSTKVRWYAIRTFSSHSMCRAEM